MSMGLYAWKGPLVSEEEAARLLRRFDEGEVEVFEASEEVLGFYDEVVAKYPDLEVERSDRVVDMSLPGASRTTSWTASSPLPESTIWCCTTRRARASTRLRNWTWF
jgi:hypothetical protein